MRIGLFGGTFDPIHVGHLILAQECWFKLELDTVLFIPTYIPPHKKVADSIDVADRLNMVRVAINGDKRFDISTYEIDKGDVSYTIDTVKYFVNEYGDENEYFFIAGADSAEDLPGWKDPEKILDYVSFVTVPRRGFKATSKYDDRIIKVEMPEVDVSSRDIRKRINSREPIDYLVPISVVKYIRNKGLYRS